MSELHNILKAPELNKKIVCISNDYVFSAQISCCFNKPDIYFAVIEPPRSLHKYWSDEFIMLNNLLAKIQPQIIIFAKVDDVMIDLIKKQLNLNENKYINIDNKNNLEKFISGYKSSFRGVIKCPKKRKKIAYALLDAKINRFRLVIDNKSQYEVNKNITKKHIVISDSYSNLLPVILANYCFAINADLQFIKNNLPYKPVEIYSVLDDTRSCEKKRNLEAQKTYKIIESILTLKVKNISKYKFATFFTENFPYGHFFPQIPTTHIYSNLLSSYFIASSIFYPFIQLQSAILVDTEFFKNSETNFIKNSLLQKEVVVKELRGNQFSNLELDNNIQFYPYDFLFICSHGNFTKGTRFKIKFFDKNNYEHIIVTDVLDSFYPTDKGTGNDRIIDVRTFYEFVELDGEPWYKKEYKAGSSKTVVEDFKKIERNKWDVLEKKEVRMKFCNVIATKDPLGPYYPMTHSISDIKSTPFIFNNACISTYTLANTFIFAGSRFYLGTVKTVEIKTAIEVAKKYFEKTLNNGKNLAISLWESQYNKDIQPENAVYVCIGCHFLKFSFMFNQKNREELKKRIEFNAFLRLKNLSKDTLENFAREGHKDAIKFLSREFQKL